MRRRRFLTISAAALCAAPLRAEVTQWQAVALGGTLRVDLRGPRGLGAETVARIGATIAGVEAAASLFRPESALSRLNAAGELADPPPALAALLALAGRVHAATAGRFDPTVQPLWCALAEGRGAAELARARATIGWDRVQLDAAGAVRLAPGQALTLNGIAQGYAADRVREVLLAAGYGPVLVDMGEFAAIGGPFTLGLEDPDWGVLATRRLSDGAIATSSPAALRLGRAFHILGPQGEAPRWSTVSVEAQSAALADGLSTAFCLMSERAIRATCARLPDVRRVTLVSPSGEVTTG